MFCQYQSLSGDGFTVYRLGHGLSLESRVRIIRFRDNHDEIITRMKSANSH